MGRYVMKVQIIIHGKICNESANHHPMEDLAKSRYEYHPFCIFGYLLNPNKQT
jgi:hypothetical protein